ncbi:hypothetical protein SP15_303 [Bacillus phage SP-15]|uniref:TM2 domain-containing protein n=1 Tax=Bacillus phage SP-15 TaxID=1792032 RepID=A0A127AZ85_9CAUD|nr:hypothetical protein SP15_303 [Bacillus phage SP-15]AMM45111.1 hypothetical protein SP15_303 [Bacillus phage SP-15]
MKNALAKSNLSSKELMILQSEVEKKSPSKVVAYLLWWFLGTLAVHRFYLKNTGYAVCMLIFGICTLFICNLIDVFFISKALKKRQDEIEWEIMEDLGYAYRNEATAIVEN